MNSAKLGVVNVLNSEIYLTPTRRLLCTDWRTNSAPRPPTVKNALSTINSTHRSYAHVMKIA